MDTMWRFWLGGKIVAASGLKPRATSMHKNKTSQIRCGRMRAHNNT